jgi:hypothetical protein
LRRGFCYVFENIGFDLFFDGIGKFHAGVGEKFYTIVLKRIVRSGDDDSGVEIILANQAGYPGSGDDAGESGGGAGGGESCGEKRGDVRAGFAGVHADQGVRGAVFAAEVGAEGAACGVERGVVERRSAGNAADAVCAEELSGHGGREADQEAKDLTLSLAQGEMKTLRGCRKFFRVM